MAQDLSVRPSSITDEELCEARAKFVALTKRRKKEYPHAKLYQIVEGPLDGMETCWEHAVSPHNGSAFGWAYHHAQYIARHAFDVAAGVFQFTKWSRANRG